MGTVTIPGGNLRSQYIDDMKILYTKLLSRDWNGKRVWEHIRDKTLTSAPCMVGEQYPLAKKQLMIVGRAVNGWQIEFENCDTLSDTVGSVFGQPNRLDDFANDFICDEKTGKKYFYSTSPFLRLMKKMVVALEGSDENWQQKIVWSNLYKVAPRDGGNPSWLLLRNDLHTYIEIIRNEINHNQPNLILFVTDANYFDHYPGSNKWPSFFSLFSDIDLGIKDLPKYIKAVGAYKDNPYATIIICERPERRPTDEMVKSILDVYAKAKGVRGLK